VFVPRLSMVRQGIFRGAGTGERGGACPLLFLLGQGVDKRGPRAEGGVGRKRSDDICNAKTFPRDQGRGG